MTFIKDTGKSGGFSKDDKREHNGGCAIIMEARVNDQDLSGKPTGPCQHYPRLGVAHHVRRSMPSCLC